MTRRDPAELTGRPLWDLFTADSGDRVREVISHPDGRTAEAQVIGPDGSRFAVQLRSRPAPYEGQTLGILVVRDIAELRHLAERLGQGQRLEVIGRLATGVIHDFNNILTVLKGYSELLLRFLGPREGLRSHVEQVYSAAVRATTLTRQLLAFSRKQTSEARIVDLNALVLDLAKMLRRLIGEDVVFQTRLQPCLGTVRVDPTQIEQVLLNLVFNARDAMPEGGDLLVETANVEVPGPGGDLPEGARPGAYAMMAVSDTGCGMDPQLQARIFEPFFTTKGPSAGAGLGLSNVASIVAEAGGHIVVHSEPERGSTFRVYLPRAEHSTAAATGRDNLCGEASLIRGVVLLVEDDENLRAFLESVLRECGYSVLCAPGPGEAERICDQHRGRIDLLLTELVMPHRSGWQLARRLREAQPDLRVLYIADSPGDAALLEGVAETTSAFLRKPFSGVEAIRRVQEVLGKKGA
jgi:signal transduction histidine kinase/CheY-like chemotaxis protein